MGSRVLLLEQADRGEPDSLLDLLRDCAPDQCERWTWDGFAPQRLQAWRPNLIVAVALQQMTAMRDLFAWLRYACLPTSTLAVLPPAPDHDLLGAVAREADDIVFAPVRPVEMAHRVRRLLPRPLDVEAMTYRLADEMALAQLVGRSAAFTQVVAQLPSLARSGMPVLITGETGTGKELCARAIHFLSERRHFPFVAIDCTALPDHLVENELFGHARGAYTDADRAHPGLIASAEGGVVFLDEIDALSLATQGKLLRFLQERTFRPLGAQGVVHADVAIIAATNRDLEACVRAGTFRPDLYFRLNVLRLHLPPLRDRRSDIDLLASHFLQRPLKDGWVRHASLPPSTLRKLSHYNWPGNVRELANVLERAAVAADGGPILPCHISLNGTSPAAGGSDGSFRQARAAAVEDFERRFIEDLLRKHNGNVTRAAAEAKKERRAMGRLIKKYDLKRHAL